MHNDIFSVIYSSKFQQIADMLSANDQGSADATDVAPLADKGPSQDKKKKKDKPKNDITCK